MNRLVTAEEILDRVRDILVDVLSLDPSEVTPAARILDQLGAESIDLLDLRFRLEKDFGIRITNQDLVQALGDTTPTEFRAQFTVEALCRYVRARLDEAGG